MKKEYAVGIFIGVLMVVVLLSTLNVALFPVALDRNQHNPPFPRCYHAWDDEPHDITEEAGQGLAWSNWLLPRKNYLITNADCVVGDIYEYYDGGGSGVLANVNICETNVVTAPFDYPTDCIAGTSKTLFADYPLSVPDGSWLHLTLSQPLSLTSSKNYILSMTMHSGPDTQMDTSTALLGESNPPQYITVYRTDGTLFSYNQLPELVFVAATLPAPPAPPAINWENFLLGLI